jgi:ribosomal protein L11 methyltransferase|tara:strand:- start:85 stop:648 length:564 start_codon:yes stop_codon:yes gene_type:complete
MLLRLIIERTAATADGGVSTPPTSLLDYGCGSGVLAISYLSCSNSIPNNSSALLASTNATAFATDVSPSSLACAARNGRLNDVDGGMTVCPPYELSRSLRVDLAVANMLPGPLISESAEIALRVRTGGELLMTGFRQQDAAAVREAFTPYFEIAHDPALEDDGWLSLSAVRNQLEVQTSGRSEDAVG